MPSADFCLRLTEVGLREPGRSLEVSSTAFLAHPPDLQSRPLMDTDFVEPSPLVRPDLPPIRFLFVGSRFCSTLLSDGLSRGRPCASLALRLHQAVRGTFTPKLLNMLDTPGMPPLRAPPSLRLLPILDGPQVAFRECAGRHPGRPRKESSCCEPCRRFLSSCSSPPFLAGRLLPRSRLRLPLDRRKRDPRPLHRPRLQLRRLLRLPPRCLSRLRPRHPRRRLRLRHLPRPPLRHRRRDRSRVSGVSPRPKPRATSRSFSTGRVSLRA
jgi:hypothetical protein